MEKETNAFPGEPNLPFSSKTTRRGFLGRACRGLAGLGGLSFVAALPGSAPGQPFLDRGRRCPAGADEMQAFDCEEFVFSRFQYTLGETGDNPWDYGPDCDEKFLEYLRTATSVRVSNKSFEERIVRVTEREKMFKSPFLFMTGNANFRLADAEREAFAEFFKRGGFLYGDDCVVGYTDNRFFEAFVREVSKIVPGYAMEPVGADNAIYHCFYDFPHGHSPVYQGAGYPDMGLFVDSRMVAFLTCTDQHCAWRGSSRSLRIRKTLPTEALQFGTNVVVFALTH